MTIQNKTARELFYQWHGAGWSPFYQTASAGLTLSYSALADECSRIDEPDRTKLMCWIQKQQAKPQKIVMVGGNPHFVLPWVHPLYLKGA